jgi:hypothetical protein
MKHRELIKELKRRENNAAPTKSQARGVRRAPEGVVRRAPQKKHGFDDVGVMQRGRGFKGA